MKRMQTMVVVMATLVSIPAMAARITFYESEDFHGRVFSTEREVNDLRNYGFNDRASSVIVDSGEWLVCEDIRYGGQCAVLRPGSYDSLRRMGVNNRISSVQRISSRGGYDDRYRPEPIPQPTYEYRRRANERLYDVPVSSVHAVTGPPEQRCWVEQQEVREPERRNSNVGGAIIGGIIGGIIGHQIGSGRGNDIATAGGAVAGAAVGANAGRGGSSVTTRDVQRCESVNQGPPDYWDVTYRYRGVEHHVQMTEPPGRTITVNRNGEPRM
ncbi:MAG: beta/gamma crystallin family protein [Steroidobacteraceae bacterium]